MVPFLTAWLTIVSDGLVTTIADCALKSSLVLVLAWIVVRTTEFRRAQALSRQWWWTAAIMITLALPVTTTMLPRWDCPYWPALGDENTGVAAATAAPTSTATVNTKVSIRGGESRSESYVIDMSPNASAARPSSAILPFSLQTLAASVWLIGLLVVVGRWLVGWVRIEWLSRRYGRDVDVQLRSICEDSCAAIGLRRRPQLKIASFAVSPMTWGVNRPTIMLPVSAVDWSEDRLRMVLLHELNHIKRHDWFFQMLTRLACGVYWFNPLSWIAASYLSLERELACDEGAVAREATPSRYAQHLVDIARSIRDGERRCRPVLSFGAHAALETRVRNVLSVGRRRLGFAFLPTIVVLAAVALTLATAAPMRGTIQDVGGTSKPIDSLEIDRLLKDGSEFMRTGDWNRAIEVFERLVASDPWHGEAWFRLGYVLHQAGRHEEALVADRRAAGMSTVWRKHALYNEACTLAVLGRVDEAVTALRASWNAGYQSVVTILEDPDLASLRGDSRFYAFLGDRVMQCE